MGINNSENISGKGYAFVPMEEGFLGNTNLPYSLIANKRGCANIRKFHLRSPEGLPSGTLPALKIVILPKYPSMLEGALLT